VQSGKLLCIFAEWLLRLSFVCAAVTNSAVKPQLYIKNKRARDEKIRHMTQNLVTINFWKSPLFPSFEIKQFFFIYIIPEKSKVKIILVYFKSDVGNYGKYDIYKQCEASVTYAQFVSLLSFLNSDNTVTRLTWLLHWYSAPKNNSDLWYDFYGRRLCKLVKFTEEWQQLWR
jgi:hypothetical protein